VRLIHLTDPHLSTLTGVKLSSLLGKRLSGYLSWRQNRRNLYLPAVLARLVAAVRAENADQILLTGDLVHIGLETEITQAAEWLAALDSPDKVMLVPGNHDIYAAGSAGLVFQSWSEYLFQSVTPAAPAGVTDQYPVVRRLGKINLIGLTTACVTPVFMASGKLGREQLKRLARLLQQAAREGQMVALLIHHPPLPGMTHWRRALTDAAALEAVLKPHPPAMIFYGHLHHNHEQQWGNSRIYCTAAASSSSDASYRVIDIEDRDDHWSVRMALKTLDVEHAGEPGIVTLDEQSWELEKVPVRAIGGVLPKSPPSTG
jgi:3',5'-cyclic AMP phosphodiesterase CpdA